MANRWGNNWSSDKLDYLGFQITANGDWSLEIKRLLFFGKKSYDKLRWCIKKEKHHFANRGLYSQIMIFSVVKYGCDIWTTKRLSAKELMLSNCGAGEDSWESLGQQGDQTSQSWGQLSWIFIVRTDVEDETPIIWPPNLKSRLIGKAPDDGKDWQQEEKGTTEDEMAGWDHWLNGHEFEQILGDSEEQPGLLQSMGLQRVGYDWVTE